MKILMISILAIGMLMFPLVGHAQVRVDAEPTEAPRLVFEDLGDTWQGPAEMSVLENGVVVISLSVVVEDEGVQFVWYYDNLAFKVETEGLSVVWAVGGEIFLDKDGIEINSRGFQPQHVYKESFPNDSDESDSHYSLLDLDGELYVEQDEETGAFQMTLVSEEGEIFEFSGSLDSKGSGARGPEVAGNVGMVGSSECSADCDGGDCNISCSGAARPAALCWCGKNGVPHCVCTKRPKKVEDGEVQY